MTEMSERSDEILYECDPDRNPECGKTGCYRNYGIRGFAAKTLCRITRKREAARLDENGEPVTIADRKAYYMGLQIGAMEIQRTLDEMERIRDVGIVNAREDLKVIESAVKWLQVLKAIW